MNIDNMDILESGASKLGLHLSPKQLQRFATYYDELTDWNRRINLTRITDPAEVQVKHFLDSLTVTLTLKSPLNAPGLTCIDVGSGAGLPGIPLKIMLPDIELTLLEALAKKADFLRHVTGKLGLDNVEVVIGRAEEVAHEAKYREKFALVLSRAVAPLPTLAELTLPFCAVAGSFICQKKGAIEPEISRAERAIGFLGGELRVVKRIDLTEFTDERYLVIIDKVSPTPGKYPRRAGVPKKSPI